MSATNFVDIAVMISNLKRVKRHQTMDGALMMVSACCGTVP